MLRFGADPWCPSHNQVLRLSPLYNDFPNVFCTLFHSRVHSSLCLQLVSLDANATQSDKIAALAHQHFNALAATIVESMVGRKVMAAIVMIDNSRGSDEGRVVSIGTGKNQSQ